MRNKTLLRLASLVIILLAFSPILLAQNRTVTGVVRDPQGAALPGVTVTIKGTNTATQTNSEGVYTINAPGEGTLVFTSVGYLGREANIAGRNTVDVELVTQNAALQEVVVIGYGTVRKKDLTGAVATVNEKNFNKGVFAAPDQLIQGKVAGVQILSNSGQPGGATTVKIRGNSAVTGSGNPLYVVDGVPLENRSARPGLGELGFGDRNPGVNPLNFLNPSDIVSIDVLKDASATAIYGSRGAFGVIIITTKKGQSGLPKVDFGVSLGFSDVMKKIEVLDASQYRAAIPYYGVSATNDKGSSVDAFDAITRQGLVQNYTMSVSGGVEAARYRFSLGYLDQEGVVNKSGIKKYTGNLTGQFKFLDSKRLGLDVSVITSQFQEEIPPISANAGSRGSLIGNALQWNPTENLVGKRPDGTDTLNVRVGGDLINPLALQEAYDDNSRTTTILGSVSPYFKFTDWLEYRYLYSINYGSGTRRTTLQPFINFNDVYGLGRARIAGSELITQQHTHTVNLNRNVAEGLSLNGLLGYEYLKFVNKGYDMSGYGQAQTAGGFGNYGLDFTNYIQYSNPTNRTINSFHDPISELQSYFARAVLNFKDKYLLTATVRRDGSSKFGEENRYGTFPSFSAAWNIRREGFFPEADFLNELKIRAGWGITGNQEFPAGSAVGRYTFNSGGGLTQNNAFNEDLKWQSDEQYNIGLDASILSNRVTLSMDYFNKKTTDLLFPTEPAQPSPAGGLVRWQNLDGEIINKGFEIAANANILQSGGFSWDFGANATFISNEVSGLTFSIPTGALNGQGSSGATVQTIRNGLPINAFYTRQYEGIDKSTGFASYTGGDQMFFVGDPNPDVLLGLSTTLRYNKFTLTANMNGAFGHQVYNETLNNVINVGSINNAKNIALSIFEDPVKENFANPVTSSSRFVEDADYLKMTSATLSYQFGNIGKIFRGVTLYVNGQNLFVITDYSGFDPEVNTDKNVNGVPSVGIEYIPYPSARTVTFGVNFSL
jgi:TonB-dependent starch-binding outer membrane protein SusC